MTGDEEDPTRVLRVDDPDAAASTADCPLRDRDEFDVTTATSPREGLELLSDGVFDCVVSAPRLQDGDALGLLDAVREECPELPFVFRSAEPDGDLAREAFARGATEFAGPASGGSGPGVLAARIERAVERTGAGRRSEGSQPGLEPYETLLETLPVGVLVLDEEATIEWVNEPFWTAIDRTEEGVTGRQFLDLIEEGVVGDDVVDLYLDGVRRLLSDEADAEQVTFEFEVDPPHEPGVRQFEGYVGLRPLVDGEFAGTVSAFLDVTERKRRERELEQYEAAMETIPDGVFLLDEEGTMLRVNEAWADLTGYDPADLNGEPFAMLIEEGVVEESVVGAYSDLLRRLLSSDTDERKGTFTTRMVPPDDDREHIYEVHIGLLPFDEAFQGAAGVVRDVTEKIERRRQLERENARLDEFASIVSHDLRNPLSVLQGALDLAEETGAPDDFERCWEAAFRMEALIDDLLELSRAGETVGSLDAVDLPTAAERAWDGVDTAEADLEVSATGAVLADDGRLDQLFENLFHNAVEHGAPDATVTVRDVPGGFAVADDGAGIPADEREAVFESGYSTAADGTGFGLPIVREIVEAHGWEISLSESADGGARFEVSGVDRPG